MDLFRRMYCHVTKPVLLSAQEKVAANYNIAGAVTLMNKIAAGGEQKFPEMKRRDATHAVCDPCGEPTMIT